MKFPADMRQCGARLMAWIYGSESGSFARMATSAEVSRIIWADRVRRREARHGQDKAA